MRYSAEYGRQTIGIVDIWAQDVGAALMRTLLAAASLIALAAGSDAGCYNAHGYVHSNSELETDYFLTSNFFLTFSNFF